MIKINLALKKQAAAASLEGGTSTSQSSFSSTMDRFGIGDRIKSVSLVSFQTPKILKIVAALVLCSVTYFVLERVKQAELQRWDDEIARLNEEQKRLQAELDKTKGYEEIKRSLIADEIVIKTKIETIRKLISDRQVPPKMLVALSTSIPTDAWLSQLSIRNQLIRFKGSAIELNVIADFIKNLQDSVYFADVKPLSSEIGRDEVGSPAVNFELEARKR